MLTRVYSQLLGITVLFVVVTVGVLTESPTPKTSEQKSFLLEAHEGILYFVEAEIMLKKLVPDSSLLWSHALVDKMSVCVHVGRDVWYARGYCISPKDGKDDVIPWEIFFLADRPQMICEHIGAFQSGDVRMALREAGIAEPVKQEASKPGK